MPILSVCVPTYNRSKLAYRCVKSILEYPDNDIEVIVSDNGSEDDTYKLLSSIDDMRLHVSRNPENKGYFYNMLQVLKLSNGNFSLYLSDEDTIIINGLMALLLYLKVNPDIAVVVCPWIMLNEDGSINNVKKMTGSLNAGFDAYCFSKYLDHITGSVFNRKYIDFDIKINDGYHPFADMVKSVCFRNKAFLLKEPIATVYPVKKDTFNESSLLAERQPLFFEPKGRKITFERRVRGSLKNDFSELQFISFCKSEFIHYLINSLAFLHNNYLFLKICVNESIKPDYYNEIAQNTDIFIKEAAIESLDFLSEVQQNKIWAAIKDTALYFYGEKEFDKNKLMKDYDKNQAAQINSFGVILASEMTKYGVEIKNSLNAAFTEDAFLGKLYSNKEYDRIVLFNCEKSMHWYFHSSKSHAALGNYDAAIAGMKEYISLYENELDLFRPCTDFLHFASICCSLARLYLGKNDKQKARYYLEKNATFRAEAAEVKYLDGAALEEQCTIDN